MGRFTIRKIVTDIKGKIKSFEPVYVICLSRLLLALSPLVKLLIFKAFLFDVDEAVRLKDIRFYDMIFKIKKPTGSLKQSAGIIMSFFQTSI